MTGKISMLNSLDNFKQSVLNGQLEKELFVLSKDEKTLFVLLVLSVLFLVGYDINADLSMGLSVEHIVIDSLVGICASFFILLVWHQIGRVRVQNLNQLATAEDIAKQFKLEIESVQKGLSDEIDRQLALWNLTPSEKEISLLLLKGLSLKEVSAIRGTSERTVRHHTLAIYNKAGVAGRAELSAFFLEDFLDRRIRDRG